MACNCGGSCGSNCGGISPCTTLGVSQNEVNTPNCTAQLGVNQGICGQSAGRLCSCNNCGCQQSTICTPTPYYLQAAGCQESHNQVLINQQWAMSGKILESFAVPSCNPPTSVTVTVPGLTQIMVGSYVQFVVGDTPIFLLVTAFDYVNQRVTLKNDECRYNVLTPGTLIPACSLFNVATIVPVAPNNSSSSYPYLAEDWTIPAIGDCATWSVLTTAAGLSTGQVIAILGNTYTVGTVRDSTHIDICNDTGSGGSPGTTITAHDYAGNHIVPVIGLTTNACLNTVVTQGALVTCKNGVQQPLDGDYYGQIPVLIDPATNDVEFRTLDVATLECTPLKACTNLTQGVNASPYTFSIDNNPAIMFAGDIIQVTYNGHIYMFEVVAAPVADPSAVTANLRSIDGVLGALPPETVCIGIGTDLCFSPCCEQLAADIDNINTTIINNCNQADAALACINQVSAVHAVQDYSKVINLESGGGNWLYYGAGNGTAYIDQPLTNNPVSFTVPSQNCGAATEEQYLVKLFGTIQLNIDGDVPEAILDGIYGASSGTLMSSIDVYFTSNMPAGAVSPIYGESGRLTTNTTFIHSEELAKYGGSVSVVKAAGGNEDVVIADGSSRIWTFPPSYVTEGFPTLPSTVDADAPVYGNLPAYGTIRYYASGFCCQRLAIPGEVLTVRARYRALADEHTMPIVPEFLGVPIGSCEARMNVYFWISISRYSATPGACV